MARGMDAYEKCKPALDTLIAEGRKCFRPFEEIGDVPDAMCLGMALVMATGGKFDAIEVARTFLEDVNDHIRAALVEAIKGTVVRKGDNTWTVTTKLPAGWGR